MLFLVTLQAAGWGAGRDGEAERYNVTYLQKLLEQLVYVLFTFT